MNGESTKPIGIFDSGLGGLTVLDAMIRRLPAENTIYLGDNARAPYGNKSPETIVKYALQDAEFLLEQGIKMLVIACNTASAQATKEVRALAGGVPVVEVITPGARAALAVRSGNKIAVLGTQGTVQSNVYAKTLQALCPDEKLEVLQVACPLFVELIEQGWWQQDITRKVAKEYLEPIIEEKIKTIVLGCTHYPLLKEVIQDIVGQDVKLIDAGDIVAADIEIYLREKEQLNEAQNIGKHMYYSSEEPLFFKNLANRFLSQRLHWVKKIDISSLKWND